MEGGAWAHMRTSARTARGQRMLALPVTYGHSADLLPWERAPVTKSLDPYLLLRRPGNGQSETQ